MTDSTEHLEAELAVEEGNRALIYDDATGLPFKRGMTLKGNLSVGIGLNLMIPFAPEELAYLEEFRIRKGQALLAPYLWYQIQDEVRQVALADIAYNIGVGGLLHWPKFLSDMGRKDYPSAVAEIKGDALWISQVHAARAGRLENMILSGTWPTDIPVPGAPA